MSAYTLRQVDQMQALHHGAVKLCGAELGIESFGMQLLEFPAGFDGYPEHDHAADGQEEVYVVIEGDAEFEIDGERVPLQAGHMVRIEPAARRKLHPGPAGVKVLAVGRPVSAGYERPEPFRLGVHA